MPNFRSSYELVSVEETDLTKKPVNMGDQTCQVVLLKGLLQVVCLIGLLMPMAYIYVFTQDYEPFHRGFFCDDQNLKHPYMAQTVPISLCIAIWAAISIFLILLIESLRSYVERDREGPIKNNRTPWIAIELYRHFGYFLLGCISCLLFTEIAKYTIGRLRPHYLTICDPDFTDELCKDPNNSQYSRFVTNDEKTICRMGDGVYNEHQLKEARLSFLSGHSSFSFFCGTFLIVYLQSRLNRFPKSSHLGIQACVRSLKIARPFVQFGLIILAFWISLTRISDYFHHPMDVVTGALVGVLFACVTLVVIADIFNKPSTFRCERKENLPTVTQRGDANSRPRSRLANPSNDIPLASQEHLDYIDEEAQSNRGKNTRI